jgi:hypothetical protein
LTNGFEGVLVQLIKGVASSVPERIKACIAVFIEVDDVNGWNASDSVNGDMVICYASSLLPKEVG